MLAKPLSIAAQKREPMAYAAVNECIRQVETQYDLLRYEVEGWCAWPMLRSPAAMVLANPPMAHKEGLGRANLLSLLGQDVRGLLSLRQARYLVKSYASALVELEGGRYKDIFFDDLLPHLGNYLKIELVNNKIFIPRSQAAFIKSQANLTSFRIAANLMAKVSYPGYLSNLTQQLSDCLTTELGPEFTPVWVARILRRFYWYKQLYGRLLDHIRPEFILVADAGEYDITAAARERGIKVIEFQHGFISSDIHFIYAWSDYARAYKAKIPLPHRLLLYGQYWQQDLERHGFWGEELQAVGSLRLDQYRQRQVAYKAVTQAGPCNLVLTTGVDAEKTVDFMTDFLKLAAGQLDVCLYLKLHPAYETNKTVYNFQRDPRVQVLLGSESPSTFELIAQAHFHISVSSTCHYEALGLSVPTVILPFATYEMVRHLNKAGHAFLAQTPQELFDIILRYRDYQVPPEVSALYFRPNALENIKQELNLISSLRRPET
jgi:hypothetical protein